MRHAAAKRASRLHVVEPEDVARRAANVRVVEIESPRGQYIARSDAELRINRHVSSEEAARHVRTGERLGAGFLRILSVLRDIPARIGSRSHRRA